MSHEQTEGLLLRISQETFKKSCCIAKILDPLDGWHTCRITVRRPLQNCTSKTLATHASFFKRDTETTKNTENVFIPLSFSVKPGKPYPRSHVAIKHTIECVATNPGIFTGTALKWPGILQFHIFNRFQWTWPEQLLTSKRYCL